MCQPYYVNPRSSSEITHSGRLVVFVHSAPYLKSRLALIYLRIGVAVVGGFFDPPFRVRNDSATQMLLYARCCHFCHALCVQVDWEDSDRDGGDDILENLRRNFISTLNQAGDSVRAFIHPARKRQYFHADSGTYRAISSHATCSKCRVFRRLGRL